MTTLIIFFCRILKRYVIDISQPWVFPEDVWRHSVVRCRWCKVCSLEPRQETPYSLLKMFGKCLKINSVLHDVIHPDVHWPYFFPKHCLATQFSSNIRCITSLCSVNVSLVAFEEAVGSVFFYPCNPAGILRFQVWVLISEPSWQPSIWIVFQNFFWSCQN